MKKIFTSILFLSFISIYTFAQNGFKYQAVARDNSGAIIANQLISLEMGIIQNNINNSPIYKETHSVTTNAYGLFNLEVGAGTTLLGNFSSIDWALNSFIKIGMDITGGSNYTAMGTSELFAVPRALYAEKAGVLSGSIFGLNVKDFGAKGDGNADDTNAFEAALDSAAITGAKVFVPAGIYRTIRTLNIKDGVSLIGEGVGAEPLQTPYNGSLIRYEGSNYAIKIIGHAAHLKDLVIRDHSSGNAAGGVMIEADGRLLESVYIFEVLISGFTGGAAFKLYAENGGGIAYGAFYNLRVRHGKIGIHIDATGNGSFINSNSFYHCQVSGGGFDYGILIDEGNNNILHGVVVEPPSTNHGHIVVKEGEIFGYEIRIEGNSQAQTTPLILFNKKTKNSVLTGVYAGGLTLDKGNNLIDMRSGKAIHYRNSTFNLFRNPIFFTPDNIAVDDWDITGNGATVTIESPELTAKHNVLKITIPIGQTVDIEPNVFARPEIKDLPLYDQVNFGFYVKTNKAGQAYVATNAPKGWTSSTPHSGSNEWEFVGMNAEVNRSQPARFKLQINNTSGKVLTVYVTTPTLNFGNQLPTLDEAPLFTSGGKLQGQLTHALADVTVPNNGFLTIPLNANYYDVTNVKNIHRINHLSKDRIPKGTVITLLFSSSGVSVTSSGYLNLKAGFTSIANSSLTLISGGDGTWREVSRNN